MRCSPRTTSARSTPAKLADLTCFDRDLLACHRRRAVDGRVLFTIVGGRVAYEAKDR